MAEATEAALILYTEATPNPETLKFVSNRMLLPNVVAEFKSLEESEDSAMARELFHFPFVKQVFITNNFITVTKTQEQDWADIMLPIKDFIREYLESGKEVIVEGYQPPQQESDLDDDEIVTKIKEMLITYVKPAVEMDGGNIEFSKYEEGVVTLKMQGACSGCPSSTVTLKSGIEGLLKRMVPEVKEVIAEEG